MKSNNYNFEVANTTNGQKNGYAEESMHGHSKLYETNISLNISQNFQTFVNLDYY